jgi:ATP synthase protein I
MGGFSAMGSNPDQEKLENLAARIRDASGKPMSAQDKSSASTSAGRLGFDFIGAVGGSTIIGVVVDRTFHTSPWGVIIMVVVGFAVGFMNMWKALASQPEDTKEN